MEEYKQQDPIVVLTPEEEEHKKEASTSMILGIVGDVLAFYPIIGIAGLVLSIVALLKSSKNKMYAKERNIVESGMNVAGKWCGIGGIIIGSIFLIIYIALFAVMVLFAFGVLKSSGLLSSIFGS